MGSPLHGSTREGTGHAGDVAAFVELVTDRTP